MELPSDLDLVDAPEFLEFLKEQNLSEESLEFIGNETKRMFDEYVANTSKVVNVCIQNASRNATSVHGRGNNQENLAPSETSSKTKSSKRSIRNSNVKSGKVCATSNRKLSKTKNMIAKQDVNNDLSQELVEKATVSNVAQQDKAGVGSDNSRLINPIPRGKVRIEIKSDPQSTTTSPHEGEIRVVEPTSNASHMCKIGRSSGKEYSEHGLSLHLDLEVSTKHGMLTRRNSSKTGYEYFFIDTSSTNGTFFVDTGDRLDANEEYKLVNGTELRMGQSILLFNFST